MTNSKFQEETINECSVNSISLGRALNSGTTLSVSSIGRNGAP